MNERDNETKQHIDLNKRITRWKRKNKAGILNRIILKYGNYSHERDFAVVYVNPHRVIPELGLNRRIPETFHSAEDDETPRKQGKKKKGKKNPPIHEGRFNLFILVMLRIPMILLQKINNIQKGKFRLYKNRLWKQT